MLVSTQSKLSGLPMVLVITLVFIVLLIFPAQTQAQSCNQMQAAIDIVGSSPNSSAASSMWTTDSCLNGDPYWLWRVSLNADLCRGLNAREGNTQFALAAYYNSGIITWPEPNAVRGPDVPYWEQTIAYLFGSGSAPAPRYCDQVSGGNTGGGNSGGGNSGGGNNGGGGGVVVITPNQQTLATISNSCKGWIGSAQRTMNQQVAQVAQSESQRHEMAQARIGGLMSGFASSPCSSFSRETVQMLILAVGGDKTGACQIFRGTPGITNFMTSYQIQYWNSSALCG